MSRSRSATASAALAALLLAAVFVGRGGNLLERTAVAEAILIAAGAAAICAAIAIGPRGPVRGGPAVAAFGALAALTILSAEWSIAPDLTRVEAGRTLAYLTVFAGAVALGRLLRGDAAAVARGILLTAVAVCAYGLAARVWPAAVDELAFTGRIGQPFDYWNALAGMAALGIVPAVWLGARRAGSEAARVLAFPATGILAATVLIAQSRGALAGAAVAVAVWLVVVPLRLRSLAVLGAGAAGAAPVAAWALSRDPFTVGLQPLEARAAVAGEFGLLLAATVAALLLAGLAFVAGERRYQPPERLRVRAGLAAIAVAVALPLAAVGVLAASERGLTGTVSDRWQELTSESAAPPTGAGRLGSVASARAAYWREALDVFAEDRLTGRGAGAFELARLAHRSSSGTARRAHGFGPQTLADLGLLGGVAALALLAAWLAAAARATALAPRRFWRPPAEPRPPWSDDRAALVALALAAVAYGTQSATDWTWFVPGLTATALLAAGFVAGHGPGMGIGGSRPRTPAAHRPGAGASARAPESSAGGVRLDGPRIAACAGVAALALLFAWIAWHPVSAHRSVERSFALLADGDPAAALAAAGDARAADRDSPEALYAIAAAYRALGRPQAALATLRIAVGQRPRDPGPWTQIAAVELDDLGRAGAARAAAGRALALDPRSSLALRLRDSASAALAAGDGTP